MSTSKPVAVYACGPGNATCRCTCGIDTEPHVCEHRWDGVNEMIDYEGGACSMSVTCSRCGMSALTHAMWNART